MYISQPTSFYYRIKELVLEASSAELCNTKDGQLTGLFRPFIDNWPRIDTLSAYSSVRGEINPQPSNEFRLVVCERVNNFILIKQNIIKEVHTQVLLSFSSGLLLSCYSIPKPVILFSIIIIVILSVSIDADTVSSSCMSEP